MKRKKYIQWFGDDIDTVKTWSCPNDQYVLHWLEQQKQYICVRCGYMYDPKSQPVKSKSKDEQQVLQIAGNTQSSKNPVLVQNPHQRQNRALSHIKRQFGDHEDEELVRSSPGLKIKDVNVQSRSDTVGT